MSSPWKNPLIWFDDGYRSVFRIARPIMEECGLKGIVSVITGKVGKVHRFVATDYPLMTVEELRILVREGWEIASHSVTHPQPNPDGYHFGHLTLRQTGYELTESKRWIMDNLGVTPTRFALPFVSPNTGPDLSYPHISPDQKRLIMRHYTYLRPQIRKNQNPPHMVFHLADKNQMLDWFRKAGLV